MYILFFFLFSACFWGLFVYAFHKYRSRYRNGYLLFLALLSTIPFLLSVFREQMGYVVLLFQAGLIALLIVPFFLIHNGIVMIRREGRHLSHLLSLALGLAILIGEVVTAAIFVKYATTSALDREFFRSTLLSVGSFISLTVVYSSMAFLIFMIYTLFLQIIPRKKDFDYVIIHGAGLLHGDQLSKLLRDRIDKAIGDVHRRLADLRFVPARRHASHKTILHTYGTKLRCD